MSVKEILLLGNPTIRRTCEKVKNFRDPEIQQLIEDLRDTLDDFRNKNGFGRGIAAPQIGVLRKVIYINIDKPLVLINPEIIRKSKQFMTLWDECFSFPDLSVKVKRHTKISVSFQNEAGKREILFAVGSLSELLQHEIDHLNGILAIDRAIDTKHIVYKNEMNEIPINKSSRTLENKVMTKEEILKIFKDTNALLEGHFQLTSGLHSPQYFQCAKVLQYPKYMEVLCGLIANHFRNTQIDVVISPAIGGIVVGQEVGRQLGTRTIFAERKDGTLQLRRGFEIQKEEKVLVCEDVTTTGGSVSEVIDIVQKQGGKVVGVGTIVDRSGGKLKLPKFYATIIMDVITYNPKECPLCQQGKPIDKPGSRGNN